MNLSSARTTIRNPFRSLRRISVQPGFLFGVIILTALAAFEMFNYSTTDYALRDLLGNLKFAGIRWATILTVAFCGIDFAGIARLFTPEQGNEEPKEVWYLFGAWLLAATMNAMLTWWGVSMAILTHNVQSAAVMDTETITRVVPVFVAIMVWVIRILIIGSLSMTGDRLIWHNRRVSSRSSYQPKSLPQQRPASSGASSRVSRPATLNASPNRSNARPSVRPTVPDPGPSHPEPTYHSLQMRSNSDGSGLNNSGSRRF